MASALQQQERLFDSFSPTTKPSYHLIPQSTLSPNLCLSHLRVPQAQRYTGERKTEKHWLPDQGITSLAAELNTDIPPPLQSVSRQTTWPRLLGASAPNHISKKKGSTRPHTQGVLLHHWPELPPPNHPPPNYTPELPRPYSPNPTKLGFSRCSAHIRPQSQTRQLSEGYLQGTTAVESETSVTNLTSLRSFNCVTVICQASNLGSVLKTTFWLKSHFKN